MSVRDKNLSVCVNAYSPDTQKKPCDKVACTQTEVPTQMQGYTVEA